MGSEKNSDILYTTFDGKSICSIKDFTPLFYSVPDIPIWKKRKTLIKKLMSISLSRNDAEKEARWIKLDRKLHFNKAIYALNIIDEWNSFGLN